MSPRGDSTPENRLAVPQPKHPPSSMESEQSLLGDLMRRPQAFYVASASVSEEDFYHHDHRVIWRCIGDLVRAGRDTDFVSVTEALRDIGELDKVGGVAYIGTLAQDCIGRAENHANRIRELAQRRALIAFAHDISAAAYSGQDSAGVFGEVSTSMDSLLRTGPSHSVKFVDMASSALEKFTQAKKQRDAGVVIGAQSGMAEFDRISGGLHGPRLIILAARPKCGKTALANQIALMSAQAGQGGYVASIEMGEDETSARTLALHAGVNVTRLQRGSEHELGRATASLTSLSSLPLWLDFGTYWLDDIVAQIAMHKLRHDIRWAVVDHIGLVRCRENFRSRNDQLGHVSWTLKQAAKRLGIPIIALSQLGRDCDKENRKPRPDDLRDSGNLEQDADLAIMLHVPMGERTKFQRIAKIGLLANRAGPSLWLPCDYEFDGPTQRFTEIAGGSAAPTGPEDDDAPEF